MNVKICCIASVAEAQLALAAGATALGLVGPMPSGPGILSLDEIATIVNSLSSKNNTFFLTSALSVEKIIQQHQKVKSSTIQIVDELPKGALADLKRELPAIDLVQVVHVIDESSIDYALAKAEQADYLLLDSGNPNSEIKELGGTGRTHNWQLSRRIIEQSNIPVYLAGGLSPDNAKQAMEEVQPYGLDLCSGVRTNGALDQEKLSRFFAAVKSP